MCCADCNFERKSTIYIIIVLVLNRVRHASTATSDVCFPYFRWYRYSIRVYRESGCAAITSSAIADFTSFRVLELFGNAYFA